eukprot:2268805-Prymnesium_polylepis.1
MSAVVATSERLAAAEVVPATEMSAVVATSRKRRRKEMLQDKWYCGFCKHYSPKAGDNLWPLQGVAVGGAVA